MIYVVYYASSHKRSDKIIQKSTVLEINFNIQTMLKVTYKVSICHMLVRILACARMYFTILNITHMCA